MWFFFLDHQPLNWTVLVFFINTEHTEQLALLRRKKKHRVKGKKWWNGRKMTKYEQGLKTMICITVNSLQSNTWANIMLSISSLTSWIPYRESILSFVYKQITDNRMCFVLQLHYQARKCALMSNLIWAIQWCEIRDAWCRVTLCHSDSDCGTQ